MRAILMLYEGSDFLHKALDTAECAVANCPLRNESEPAGVADQPAGRVLRVSVAGYHEHLVRRRGMVQRRHLSNEALLVHIRAVYAAN